MIGGLAIGAPTTLPIHKLRIAIDFEKVATVLIHMVGSLMMRNKQKEQPYKNIPLQLIIGIINLESNPNPILLGYQNYRTLFNRSNEI